MIKKNKLDDICDLKKLGSMSDGEILSLIINRQNHNVLSCLPMLTTEYDETLELMNILYKQDILDNSPITDFSYFAIGIGKMNLKDVSYCTIIVESESEEIVIKNIKEFKDYRIIYKDEFRKNPDFKVDPIYAKSYLDFFHKDGCFYDMHLTRRNIYIQNTVYNTLSEDIKNSELLKNNKIGLFGLWSV